MPAALPVDWNAIRIACVSGAMQLREAAEAFGIAEGTIFARSAREGWYDHKSEIVPCKSVANASLVQASAKTVADAVSNTLADDKRRTKAAMAKIARKTTEHVADMEPEKALGKAKDLAALGTAYKGLVGDDPAAGNLMLQLNFFSGERGSEPAVQEAEVLEN